MIVYWCRGSAGAGQGAAKNEPEASRVHATSLFRFAGILRMTARQASRSLRAGQRGFGAQTLTRISNFWALAARYVIGKSWKIAEIVEFWPGLSRRRRNHLRSAGGNPSP
jgi:hypothetical protein